MPVIKQQSAKEISDEAIGLQNDISSSEEISVEQVENLASLISKLALLQSNYEKTFQARVPAAKTQKATGSPAKPPTDFLTWCGCIKGLEQEEAEKRVSEIIAVAKKVLKKDKITEIETAKGIHKKSVALWSSFVKEIAAKNDWPEELAHVAKLFNDAKAKNSNTSPEKNLKADGSPKGESTAKGKKPSKDAAVDDADDEGDVAPPTVNKAGTKKKPPPVNVESDEENNED